MAKTKLTQEILKSLLHYNRSTGVWTWKVDRGGGIYAGDIAGGLNADGYVQIWTLGRNYLAHRLAWLYVKGRWPRRGLTVDHYDTDKSNNRWKNLREVTKGLNAENQRTSHRDSKTGLQGVIPVPSGRFKAEITAKGKRLYLGTYDTAEVAHQAYLTAKRKYHEGSTL